MAELVGFIFPRRKGWSEDAIWSELSKWTRRLAWIWSGALHLAVFHAYWTDSTAQATLIVLPTVCMTRLWTRMPKNGAERSVSPLRKPVLICCAENLPAMLKNKRAILGIPVIRRTGKQKQTDTHKTNKSRLNNCKKGTTEKGYQGSTSLQCSSSSNLEKRASSGRAYATAEDRGPVNRLQPPVLFVHGAPLPPAKRF